MAKIAFLGGARYSEPLGVTSEKKFRALKSLGEIFVIGFSQDLLPRRFAEHAQFYLMPNLPLPVLRYAEMFTLGPLLALWIIFRHGVQVLVAQSPYEGFAAAWAKVLARLLGKRVVLVVESHGDFEVSLFLQRRILFPALYRLLMRQAACFAFRHADQLRAISNSTREQMERWAPVRPILQFPTWTDIEVFFQSGHDEREGSFQDILYAGVLIPLKGVHHLINAFACIAKKFPQARLVIVGREENKAYATELKEQVRQVCMNGQVQFVGEGLQAELAIRMRQARVLVLPSLSEGLGRVVVEAMATATPVIGSSVGGIPEMVQEGVTGFLVVPGDAKSLADRLLWLLTHPEEAEAMGSRAREFARRLYSTEAYVRHYGELFAKAQRFLTENTQVDAITPFQSGH